MRNAISVNRFEVEFYSDGYPYFTSIKLDGQEIARLHHSEVQDLLYALKRTRRVLKSTLPTDEKGRT